MGNKINKDITNKYVIISEDYVSGSVAERVFFATGGFGCRPDTIGKAVYGEFIATGEDVRVEGYMCERFATEAEVSKAKRIRKTHEHKKAKFTHKDIKTDEKGIHYVEVKLPVSVRVTPLPKRNTKQGKKFPHHITMKMDALSRRMDINGDITDGLFNDVYRYVLFNWDEKRLKAKEKKEGRVGDMLVLTKEQLYRRLKGWAFYHMLIHLGIFEHPLRVTVPDKIYAERFLTEPENPLK